MTDSEKLDLILEKVSKLETELQEVKQRVIKTDLTIENEIRVNIQRVAEGHLDLSRKLNVNTALVVLIFKGAANLATAPYIFTIL